MQFVNHSIRLAGASLLALLLSGYLYSSAAHAEGRDISHVNRSVHVEAHEDVGNVSSVNGRISIDNGANARDLETVNGRIQIDDDASVADAETVNGGIRVGRNVVVNGSLQTVNGGITTRSGTTVERSIQTVNGRIELTNTRVGKDVQTSNGDISLEDGTIVEGDLIVRGKNGFMKRLFGFHHDKPEIRIDGNSAVLGDIHLYRETDLEIDSDAQVGDIVRHY